MDKHVWPWSEQKADTCRESNTRTTGLKTRYHGVCYWCCGSLWGMPGV